MRRRRPPTVCPDCGDRLDKVIDSRPAPGVIRRRRRICLNGHRWWTVEVIVKEPGRAA